MSTMGNSYYTEGLKNLKQGQLMKAMACFHKAGGEGHGGAMARKRFLLPKKNWHFISITRTRCFVRGK